MDLQNEQLQEERRRTQEIQRREGQIAKEQWQNAMRQYQPIMNEQQFQEMEARQVQVAKDSMQEYLNRTVLQSDMLQEKKQAPQLKPAYRASVLEEPVSEPTLTDKKQEKRLKQLRRTNQYADSSTVLMQEEATKVQQRLAEEHEKRVRLEQVLNGDGTVKKKHAVLDNRLEELLHSTFCPEILAGDQLEQRYGQLLVRDKQMAEFVEILNQNAEYMQSKSPAEQERIQYFIDLAQTFHSVLSAVSRLKGLDFGGQERPQNDEEYQQVQMEYATSLHELVEKSRYTRIEELDTRMLEAKVEAEFQKNEQGYVNERGIRENGYAEMRREIKGDFDWLNVEHITDFYQVEEIVKLGSKIEKNPEAYAANRQLIDSIMLDLVQHAEAMGRCAAKAKISGAVQLDYANPQSKELDRAARKINAYYQGNYDAMSNRMIAMLDSVRIVLGIQKPDSKMALQYLEEKHFMIPEQEQLKEDLQYEACYYADLMSNKKGLYEQLAQQRGGIAATSAVLKGENARKVAMLRERKKNPDGTQTEPDENWNQQVMQLAEWDAVRELQRVLKAGTVKEEELTQVQKESLEQYNEEAHYTQAKDMIREVMNKVLDFDMSRLYDATPEKLMAMQRELQEIMIPQMAVSDIGKMLFPEGMKEERQRETGVVPKSMKEDALGERLKEYGERSILIRQYADMARGYAMQEAAKQGVLTKDAMTDIELAKTGVMKLEDRTQILNKLKTYADEKLIMDMKRTIPAIWKGLLGNVDVMKGVAEPLLKEVEDEPKTKRYSERFFHNSELSEHDAKMNKWLSGSWYRLAGEDKSLIKEALFRSFKSMMDYPSLNAMSDEETDLMLEQLAAGAFLTETSTQEEIQAAKEANMKGLRTYVATLKNQYSYIMRKYGLGLDNISGEDALIHCQEMEKEFSNLQVDYHMIKNLPEGILDMNNEEDKLFYNQVRYYNGMGSIFGHVKAVMTAVIEGRGASLQNAEGVPVVDQKGTVNYNVIMEMHHNISMDAESVETRAYLRSVAGIRTQVDWNQTYGQ